MPTMSRIDMKIDLETKLLAERAAAACGQSLSAYLYSLIRKDAPQVLAEQQQIIITNQQYDAFIQACEQESDWEPSAKLTAVMQQMDEDGFKWR